MSTISSGQQSTDSLNGKLTFEQDKNRIVGRDQDNKARLIILADGDEFSMKVAKAGFDVLTATGPQLIFNSSQNVFKIVVSGTATMTLVSETTKVLTIPHGLGYAPIPWVFINTGGFFVPLPYPGSFIGTSANSGEVTSWYNCGTTTTDLIISRTAIGSAPTAVTSTIGFKYYLLQETASNL